MIQVYEGLKPLFLALEGLKIPYAVVGSFASGSWGQPRQTNDLDMVLAMGQDQVGAFAEALSPSYYLDRIEIDESLKSDDPYRGFQMIHEATNFKIDVFVPPLDDFSCGVLKRAQKIEMVPGVFARCESAEDTVLSKLRWFELGNRVSDRQWNDIVQVLEVRVGLMDLEYMRSWASHFDLTSLLEDALSQVRPLE